MCIRDSLLPALCRYRIGADLHRAGLYLVQQVAALVLRDLAGYLFKDAVRELDDDGVHHIRRVADLRIAAVAAHHRLIAALGQLEEQWVVAGDVVLPVKYSFCEFDDPAAAGEKFRQFCAAGQTRLDTRQQLLKTQERDVYKRQSRERRDGCPR